MKIDKRLPPRDRWIGDKKHGTKYRYPKDLDKFEGDPAGQGGAYIDPTHLRLPDSSNPDVREQENLKPHSVCTVCHGRTYQPIESRLAKGHRSYHRCENCGHEELYPDPFASYTAYKVNRNGDKVTLTDKDGRPLSASMQEKMGFHKKFQKKGR
tara:strand:- start:131 stop:592 length:462 start_codon:yes stop_codon:yes gene_type:complete